MDRAVFVYTTFPSLVEAEAAAKVIVKQRLAACANIMPGMISHYRREGKVERAEEVVAISRPGHRSPTTCVRRYAAIIPTRCRQLQ